MVMLAFLVYTATVTPFQVRAVDVAPTRLRLASIRDASELDR